jgi:hypothetical protein
MRDTLHAAICVSRAAHDCPQLPPSPRAPDRPMQPANCLLVCCPDSALQGVTGRRALAGGLAVPAAATLLACRSNTKPAARPCFETVGVAISSGPFIPR